jgi:hypothetical protein
LRQKIDAAIEKLLADGTIRDIYMHYGVEHRAGCVALKRVGRNSKAYSADLSCRSAQYAALLRPTN